MYEIVKGIQKRNPNYVLTEMIAWPSIVVTDVGSSKTRINTNLYTIYTMIHRHVNVHIELK